jgi:glycosyltransferase involved in cell wall biosynthesis
VVFLTSYARDIVMRVAKHTAGGSRTIPHGIDERFTHPPRAQLPAQAMDRPFRILYVSIIDVYKHQVEVVAAVAALRATGIPVELDLVGPAYPPALNRLERRLSRIDPGACLCVIHRRRKIRGTARSVRSR